MKKTHWKRYDNRNVSLSLTIENLENAISELKAKTDEIQWYDGIWFLEEVEPIIGITFITLQNYINSSIYDRFKDLKEQYTQYKIGTEFKKSGRSKIELIIALANYFKHRDHPDNLKRITSEILNDFNLQINKNIDIEKSPLFKGLVLLSENWKLTELTEIVEEWREKLWNDDKKH